MSMLDHAPWIVEHIKLYQTDPEKAHTWDTTIVGGPGPVPTLLLTSIGRKSGKPRPLPLIYKEVDGAFVVIASKGGTPEHPLWYENLVANPDCQLQIGAKSVAARARTADGDERTRLWDILLEVYAPYTEYQDKTTRQIPVVVLDPA